MAVLPSGCNRFPIVIRSCGAGDIEAIYRVINDSARAYQGTIPEDCWKEPYLSWEEIQREMDEGVRFWGYQQGDMLCGVMGSQLVENVSLIRHAYVLSSRKREGIGYKLLLKLTNKTVFPQLVGTWSAAQWAIQFYQKYGFRLLPESDKERLLKRYWSIPDRQVEASVVLADQRYFDSAFDVM